MEFSQEIFPTPNNHCQNPFDVSPCQARQYLMCPHCSFHLCYEHAQQHQKQIQNEILSLHNQSQNLENILNAYQPVQTMIEQISNSLNEWKQKMHYFIDQYAQQIQMHIDKAQDRLNDQWDSTKEEYLQMLDHFIREPVDQLLKGFVTPKSFFFYAKDQHLLNILAPEQIHPDQVRDVHSRLIHVQNQITNLLSCRDLLRINFDSCSLTGDINISRGHFPSPTINSFVSPSIQSFHSLENIPHLDDIHLLYRFDALSTDTSPLGVSSYRMNNVFVTWTKPSTLNIFDAEHGLIKRVDVEPSFISINDIVWCDYFNLFLIAGAALHTFDVNNNEIKDIFTPENPQIWSITTHRTNLYICYVMGQSPLIEHRSLPSFHIIQAYTRSQVLPTNSSSIVEIARCIRTNEHHLAMTIRNLTTYEWRVDIFDFHLQRLFKGEILGHAAYPDYWCCLLTSYRSSWWLVMNNTSKQETLTLVDREARVREQIEHEGYNICVLQGEQRVIIKDQQGLAIFRI